uniref:Putative secreted protein n=1 Tax=Rhipicephalus microplus TaxID=6941 RepID=A0A6G5A2K3_RHIMP
MVLKTSIAAVAMSTLLCLLCQAVRTRPDVSRRPATINASTAVPLQATVFGESASAEATRSAVLKVMLQKMKTSKPSFPPHSHDEPGNSVPRRQNQNHVQVLKDATFAG